MHMPSFTVLVKLRNEQERGLIRRSPRLIPDEPHELRAERIEILPIMVLRIKRERAEVVPVVTEGISFDGHLSAADIPIELLFG